MAFWIKNNEKAKKEWKVISNILYYTFLGLFAIRIFVKLISSDKIGFDKSLVNNLWLWVGGTALIISLLLNLIHWLKPKWFESKN